MISDEIKKISIGEYLENRNITPARRKNHYGMYHSPFREDTDASMKVDYAENLWIDFGTGEGGTIIDLVMRINNCSFNQAIAELSRYDNIAERQSTPSSFHWTNSFAPVNTTKRKPAMQITGVRELAHPALLQFLAKRCISLDLSRLYCNEVHYSVNGKPYFAIGFRNDNGGWAFRNEFFKGCNLMDVKTFLNVNNKPDADRKSCLVFEGFTDFLSYLTLKRYQKPKEDTFVLNSVINLPKVKNRLTGYQTIYAFLDNDEGGRMAVRTLQTLCKDVHDQSVHYANYKDLNDYLCSRQSKQQPAENFKKSPLQLPKKRKRGFGL